ncbi:MAG TPA: outer membrane beta-barrel protein [Candidatus Bacteroides avicola]|uniref:Outer membrane beta-barrel protein n=1 Tax=Candidatus Bacteroides avicola TaxID=2838468 RepID=A0A9D2KV70_9BACE|nr:outer membrane beta-barrel protein [Candidatus Bacteroides avicola]
MKRLATWTLLLWAVALTAFSQNKTVDITGRVMESDSQLPAIAASVQLLSLPDSTQVTGMATTSEGYYRLQARPGKYVLRFSYIGYTTQDIPVQVSSTPVRMKEVTLQTDAVLLKEAVVTAQAPQVQVVEDTIQFNSSAYRTPQGAVLQDLVEKLPGAEVDESGNVKINGKDISKVMVNGEEFFGGDVSTALKNLPVEMIDKLKTYDKKSDLARITGIDDGEEETVLDLTVKKEMNTGWFGNVDGAIGTKDRYSARGMINYFRGSTQVSLIGSMNNVNDQGFSGGGGGPRWNRNNGLTTRKWVGMNFFTKNDKIELGGSARYNYTGNDVNSIGSTEDFLTSGNSFSNSNSQARNNSKDFHADFRMEWKPDTMTNIIFRPNVSFSKTDNLSNSESGTFNSDPYSLVDEPNDYLNLEKIMMDDPLEDIRVNAINSGTLTDGKDLSVNGTLQVNRKLSSTGRNLTFRGRFSYGDNVNKQYTESETHYFQLLNYLQTGDSILIRNQYIHTPTKDFNYRAQLTYSEPIAKNTFLQFSYQFQYMYSESDRRTYDLYNNGLYNWGIGDPLPDNYESSEVDSLGRYAEYRYYNHDASVALRFIREKWQLSAGMSFQPQHTVLSYKRGDYMVDTARNVFNFAPNIDFRYRFSKVSQLRFFYRGRSSQPSMENLLPITDNSNPQNIRVGNPGLKPSFSHNLRLFYNTYDAKKQRGIFSHASFQATQNSISNSRVYNEATGGWTTTPKNINGNWNLFGMFGFNTALKDKRFNISTFTNVMYQNNVGYLTDTQTRVEQKNTTTNLNLNERLRASFRNDWLEVGLNGTVGYTIERDRLTPSNNQKPYTFSYGGFTNITAPWNMSLSTNLSNQSRRGYRDNSMNRNELIWNAQISQTFLKGDATLSLEFYDILHQQSNITRSLTSSGRSVYEYNGVNSYCMLRFIYRLNIFGGKKVKREDMPMGGGPGGFRGRHRRF